MADDPDRDILPVKEGSYADTLISAIDPRERHLVCKLDRYQLEDKYLRLLDEASSLKKLNNCQEDKIKRLGTKLIRLAANPRSYGLSLDIVGDDKNRMSALEHENAKLKEKVTVMRNQLLSHTMSGRSSSRSRNLVRPASSGFVTCRSENNRSRAPSCQCIVDAGRDDSDVRNYLVKIEKLETQKKDMASRITDLEKELALYSANSQREKVADNVEYIRVWRQMNQLNEKLITSQNKKAALTAEINELKTTVEQTTRNSQEMAAVLTSERTRLAEMDNQITKAKNSQLALREKEEQVHDLTNEMKILQQHNNELIALSSKYGQVEMENIELKKKLSENAHEQQSLRTAFNNDQANIVALQASNEQLLTKFQNLQATIDTLTVQLTSLHKRDVVITSPPDASASAASKKEGDTSTRVCSAEQCKKCCEMYDKVMQLEKAVDSTRRSWQSVKSVETITTPIRTREQSVMTIQTEEKVNSRLQSPVKERKTNHETNSLSREKILKLLDQVQINTPLDASMITQKEEYTDILDVAQTQRHSDGEIPSQTLRDEPNLARKSMILENETSNQILLMLLDVLHEYLLLNNADEQRQVLTVKGALIDVNNNLAAKGHDFSANGQPCKYQRAGNTRDFADVDERVHKSCSNIKNCLTNLESNCYPSDVPEKPVVVLTKNVGSSLRDTQEKATCWPATGEKSRKSAYRDISNDQTEQAKISLSPKCDLMCHLRKQKNSPAELEKRAVCKGKCLGDKVQVSVGSVESFPLLISDKQGLIEIHVTQLQLSTATKISAEEDLCDLNVYISWNIWGEKTAYTMAMKCPQLNFNFSSVYRIADLSSFFKNMLLDYLVFRVNVVRHDNTRYTIARARVSIKDILDYPQNKMYYIVPVNSVVSCTYGANFGQLALWVRLSCDIEMVEDFKEQCSVASLRDSAQRDTHHRIRFPTEVKTPSDRKSSVVESAVPTDNRYLRSPTTYSNSLNETTNSDDENNYVSSNNEEFSPTPAEEANKMLEENNEKYLIKHRSVPEVAADERKEIQKVPAPQESQSVVEFKDVIANKVEKDTIIIEIVSVLFFSDSFVIRNDEIRLIFVEYSFLGHYGEDMETVSVEKPRLANQEVFFNFRKKFRIDKKKHTIERNTLCAMLTEYISPNIKFVVVSEPLPEETSVKECIDIGVATLDVREYALGNGCIDVSLAIKDDNNRDIGILKIAILGLDAIKQCSMEIKTNNLR